MEIVEEDNIQNQSNQMIIWESKERIWHIDWVQIWYELKYWEPPWQFMKLTDFLKAFFLALIGLLFSTTDVKIKIKN